MNNNEPPQKNPKNWEKKTSIFNTFETMPDTPKTNLLININTSQKQTPKKYHFAMFKNNPLVFINFLFFFNIQFLFLKTCVLLKTL